MIKPISIERLIIGMYVHQLGTTDADISYWRRGLLINSTSDLQKILSSRCTEVLIDTTLGLDDLSSRPLVDEDGTTVMNFSDNANVSSFNLELNRAAVVVAESRLAVVKLFTEVRMGRSIDAKTADYIVEAISGSVFRDTHALISLARLKKADEYTFMHSVAVCALMTALAKELKLGAAQVRVAALAGLLHDIGKLAVSKHILEKPGRLTDDEFAEVRQHPSLGAMMLKSAGIDESVIDVCLHHHERYDGAGYPSSLSGDQISVIARMGAVCDVYDALTSNRPYKKSWGPGYSIRQMASWKGHFDPMIFQAFVKTVGIYPVGTLVRLSSDRIGLVMEQNTDLLLLPKVLVLMCALTRMMLPKVMTDLSASEDEKITRIEQADDWGLIGLDSLWRKFSADLSEGS